MDDVTQEQQDILDDVRQMIRDNAKEKEQAKLDEQNIKRVTGKIVMNPLLVMDCPECNKQVVRNSQNAIQEFMQKRDVKVTCVCGNSFVVYMPLIESANQQPNRHQRRAALKLVGK